MPQEETKGNPRDYFELYKQYTTNLRNWFVIYGVGGVVLFASHGEAFALCSISHKARISVAFLLGVFVQITVAYINKYTNWHLSEGEDDSNYKKDEHYIKAEKWSKRIWFDIWADRISILAFLWATVELIFAIAFCMTPQGIKQLM